MIFTASAVGVSLLARANGGFEVGAWAPAGAVLVLLVAALLALGFRPGVWVTVGAAALVGLGLWALLSTEWGGIPDEAWHQVDKSLIAAAALVLGSFVAAAGWGRMLAFGVLAGIVLNAGEILLRSLFGSAPLEWVYGRTVDGTLGYHNAQANLCAIGACLAVSGMARSDPRIRAMCGAALGLTLGMVLLTQSRAGLGLACIAIAVVLLWARSVSLVLRVLPAFVAVALLLVPLRAVDRALVDKDPAEIRDALQSYAAWVLVATVALAVCALLVVSSRRIRLRIVVSIAVIGIIGLGVGSVVELRSAEPFGGRLSRLDDSDPNRAAGGSTRLASLALNGRRDAWRVAWDEGISAPLVGQGQGTFTRAWVRDRRLEELYILQPHSIVLELFSELGLVGLALFLLAVAGAGVAATRGNDRLAAAGALGALTALVGQAAVDWTWSFPGLVVPVMLVAGAASGSARRRAPAVLAVAVGAAGLLLALGSLLAPWKAQREIDAARSARAVPTAALARLDTARQWNPWNATALELRGSVLEEQGDFSGAAGDYARAAELSRSSWLDHFREARAARAGGDGRVLRDACARAHAENPPEHRLYWSICDG